MARVMTGIHKGGRPEKYNKDFYMAILNEFEDNTYSMIAKNHNVNVGTVGNWIRKARQIVNEQTKSK